MPDLDPAYQGTTDAIVKLGKDGISATQSMNQTMRVTSESGGVRM